LGNEAGDRFLVHPLLTKQKKAILKSGSELIKEKCYLKGSCTLSSSSVEVAHAPHWTGVIGRRLPGHPLSSRHGSFPARGEHPTGGDAYHLRLWREHPRSAPGSQLAPLHRLPGGIRRGRCRADPLRATRCAQSGDSTLSPGTTAAGLAQADVPWPESQADPDRTPG